MNKSKQPHVDSWNIEHADLGLNISHTIVRESFIPKIDDGINNIETDKKMAGFNVRHTTMYGSKCSA